jgi:SMC interacting uncharacterized protein involved in chromosome segregation
LGHSLVYITTCTGPFSNSVFNLQEAMEEKYRLCDETLHKLLEWISDVEDQLANQDLLKEHIEELRNQINNVKVSCGLFTVSVGSNDIFVRSVSRTTWRTTHGLWQLAWIRPAR